MILKNKVIVITGGTKGLGKSLSESLALRKNKVVVTGRSISKDFTDKQNKILNIKADVTKEYDIKELANFTVKTFGRIDIWINNAGIWLPHAPIEKMDIEKVHYMIEVNLFGTIYGSKYALMQMKKQKNGTIVNILSSSALKGSAGSSAYCASKFAASGFSKSLRLEVEKNNIKVISVYTRGIKTNLFDEQKPVQYKNFMEPIYISKKIISNLEASNPEDDLIIMS